MAISECLSLSKENRIHSTDTSAMPQIDETRLQGSPNFPVAIYSIGQICELCGFDDNSYFSKSFKEMYHCTPLAYREKS